MYIEHKKPLLEFKHNENYIYTHTAGQKFGKITFFLQLARLHLFDQNTVKTVTFRNISTIKITIFYLNML